MEVKIGKNIMVLKKYFGDKAFYKMILAIAVPIMIQNGITNFVSLLDNIMVGSLGTEAMSGVSIVNQFVFIFNLLIFGAVSAAGIFTAQYHGIGNREGKMYTFRFKLLINIGAALLGIAVLVIFREKLISLFLHQGEAKGDLALTLSLSKKYLGIILIGLIPYAVSQVYASTMRETDQTVVPMFASIAAVLTNFILNYILIFGKLGMPALGVSGAAIATVVSRFAELLVLTVWAHKNKDKCDYLHGAFSSFRVPSGLASQIIVRGFPLMFNEVMWALALTVRNQSYSIRGLDAVAAFNIANTVVDLFSVIYIALGSAISIVVGNQLGAGAFEKAKDTSRKMVVFSILCSVVTGLILIICSGLFPMIYNTSETVKNLASYMITVSASVMPFIACANAAYFTIRSGGKVLVTILFDSVFSWVVVVPAAFVLSRFTSAGIHTIYFVCQYIEILKTFFGLLLLKKGTWIKQLVTSGDEISSAQNFSK